MSIPGKLMPKEEVISVSYFFLDNIYESAIHIIVNFI